MKKLNFSYASKVEHNFTQRLVIKLIENLTGKRKLEKLYKNYSLKPSKPQDFWGDVLELMKIKVIDKSKTPLYIQKNSLMIIANHPFTNC